jgi:hypothetical protein
MSIPVPLFHASQKGVDDPRARVTVLIRLPVPSAQDQQDDLPHLDIGILELDLPP